MGLIGVGVVLSYSYLGMAQEQNLVHLPILYQPLSNQTPLPTPSNTPTLSPTTTNTPTPSETATFTATPTFPPTVTNTPTPTPSGTATASSTPTLSPTATNTPTFTPTPFPSCPYTIYIGYWGDMIELENFTCGGEGISYHDTSPANEGGAYRPDEAVDILPMENIGDGFYLSHTEAGEWLRYKLTISGSRLFYPEFHYASVTESQLQIFLDGVEVTLNPLILPNSGGEWVTYYGYGNPLVLVAGEHILEIKILTGGTLYNKITTTWVTPYWVTPFPTLTPTPTPTGTIFPTATPPAEANCPVAIEEPLISGQQYVGVTGNSGDYITITDLTLSRVIGSGYLPTIPVSGHACPSFAWIPIIPFHTNIYEPQATILVESSNGTFDFAVVTPQ